MQYYTEAKLTYIGHTKLENGSPKDVSFSRCAKVKEIKQFSNNFYTSNGVQQRSLRNQKNLVVAKWLTNDVIKNGIRYELVYVEYCGLKYHIRDIMEYYKSGLRMILDIEELR